MTFRRFLADKAWSIALMITVALLLVIYGGYFYVTYYASRSMIHSRD